PLRGPLAQRWGLYKLSFTGEPGTTPSGGVIAAQRRFAGQQPSLIN
ncbi:hypothetical protein A2U01_0020103, partial [Trifolium medium]|nr:hypothetical protein [Trifolium medium]